MRKIFSQRAGSLTRAVGVICAVVIVVTGVTLAALQSPQAILSNNTISSATADLKIGTSAASFAALRTGFEFEGLVPGGPAMPVDGHTFYLKNYSSGPLTIKVSIGSIPINLSSADLSKISLVLSKVDSVSPSQSFSVQSLVDAYPTGGLSLTDALPGETIGQYKIQFQMDAGALSTQSAVVSDVDIVFVGFGA